VEDDPAAAVPVEDVVAVVVPVVEVADPFEAFAAEAVRFAADPAEAAVRAPVQLPVPSVVLSEEPVRPLR